jgi:hypothetical protein
VDPVDPEPLCGGGAQHRDGLLGSGGVQIAASLDADADGARQPEAGRVAAA